MAYRRRRRAPNDGGTIDQRPSGRWRLRVRIDGRQVSYRLYETEEEAWRAQARWRLTHLLPADDPDEVEPVPANVTVGGVRCNEWFARWQQAKAEHRSLVRLGDGEDRLIFELPLGTGGRRCEVAGLLVRDVDLAAGRVWVREPVVEVEGSLVRNRTPKGGHRPAIIVGPQLALLLSEHLVRRAPGARTWCAEECPVRTPRCSSDHAVEVCDGTTISDAVSGLHGSWPVPGAPPSSTQPGRHLRARRVMRLGHGRRAGWSP